MKNDGRKQTQGQASGDPPLMPHHGKPQTWVNLIFRICWARLHHHGVALHFHCLLLRPVFLTLSSALGLAVLRCSAHPPRRCTKRVGTAPARTPSPWVADCGVVAFTARNTSPRLFSYESLPQLVMFRLLNTHFVGKPLRFPLLGSLSWFPQVRAKNF